ncbi:MAG TPA: ABC transporter permease [Usitatibacter sp.]|nr:ABC transporter permease [Usitatibacter sp.]HYC55801.1 ABC transporter permease [Candidatus Binatia bacterium]
MQVASPEVPGRAAALPASITTKVLRFLGRVARALALPAMVIAAWQAAVASGALPPRMMPSPLAVATTAYDFVLGNADSPGAYAFSGSFAKHAWVSTLRVLHGFSLAVVAGVSLGLMLGMSRTLERFVDPVLQVVRPIPITAWLPLSIIWFGLGHRATIFLIFLGAFFPILISTTTGVKMVDRRFVEAAQMLGTSARQLFYRVYLPASLPSILAGMRVGLGFAWVCLVVGEMTGVGAGLGSAIADARELFRVDLIIVGMLLIGLIGYASDMLVVYGFRRALRWSPGLFR